VAAASLFTFAAKAADLPSIKGEPTAPSIASCDFFQNQLIGAFCDRTYGATVTVEHEQYRAAFASPYGWSESWMNDWVDETVSAYIVPLPWLKLNLSTEHNNYTQSYLSSFNNGPKVSKLSNAAWQNLGATARLLDYNTAGLRAFVSANATIGFLPAYDYVGVSYGERTYFAGGFSAGLHYVLGVSDYSLNPLAAVNLGRYNHPGQTEFSTSAQVLLAQDVWGVAAGPLVTTNALSFHPTSGPGFPAQEYFAGAHLVVEPFRLTGTPVLKDVVANFDILHSLGRPNFTYYYIPNADEMIYKGSLQFNFGS
jgi:hypothetical protein